MDLFGVNQSVYHWDGNASRQMIPKVTIFLTKNQKRIKLFIKRIEVINPSL